MARNKVSVTTTAPARTPEVLLFIGNFLQCETIWVCFISFVGHPLRQWPPGMGPQGGHKTRPYQII